MVEHKDHGCMYTGCSGGGGGGGRGEAVKGMETDCFSFHPAWCSSLLKVKHSSCHTEMSVGSPISLQELRLEGKHSRKHVCFPSTLDDALTNPALQPPVLALQRCARPTGT